MTEWKAPAPHAKDAETSAAAGDGGRSYESAVACLSRGTEPSRPREGVGIVALLGEAPGQEGGTADPEAGA